MSAADAVDPAAATVDPAPTPTTAADGKGGRRGRRRPDYTGFRQYIYALVRTVDPEVTLAKSAIDTLEDMLLTVMSRLVTEASSATKYAKRQTVTHRDIQLGARLVLTIPLFERTRERSATACAKFSKSFGGPKAKAKGKGKAAAAAPASDAELMNTVV